MIFTNIRQLTALIVLIVTAGLTGACIGAGSRDPEQGYKNFQKAIAKAPQDGYTAYWLGRNFQAGGLTFLGPSVDDWGASVEGGGLRLSYNARGGGSLALTLYSEPAWEARASKVRLPANALKRDVTVAGASGELYLIPAGTRPVDEAELHLHLGDTWVLALAGSVGPAKPGGPDANPLIEEQTFLSVMQQLRPYPQ